MLAVSRKDLPWEHWPFHSEYPASQLQNPSLVSQFTLVPEQSPSTVHRAGKKNANSLATLCCINSPSAKKSSQSTPNKDLSSRSLHVKHKETYWLAIKAVRLVLINFNTNIQKLLKTKTCTSIAGVENYKSRDITMYSDGVAVLLYKSVGVVFVSWTKVSGITCFIEEGFTMSGKKKSFNNQDHRGRWIFIRESMG